MIEESSKVEMDEAYKRGFSEAIAKAIKVVQDYQPYTPYIVGKIKINERKAELVAAIKALIKCA